MIEQLDQLVEQSPHLGLHTVVILIILVGLEAVLSADNAIALAAIVQGLNNVERERKALDLGIAAAFVMRMVLIFTATWVIQYWQFELLGALYLLWLAGQYFLGGEADDPDHHGAKFSSLWQVIPLIAMTDVAFSLDSVTTAIALADDRWVVITGGVIGIITLRFLAELFIRWLQEYTHLQDAGYLTVTLVGGRLLLRVINDAWVLPEWAMVAIIGVIFAWGFSKRHTIETNVETVLNPDTDAVDLAESLSEQALEAVAAAREPEATSLQ